MSEVANQDSRDMTVHHRQRTKQCNQQQANLKTVSFSCLISHRWNKCSKFVTFPYLSIPNPTPLHLPQNAVIFINKHNHHHLQQEQPEPPNPDNQQHYQQQSHGRCMGRHQPHFLKRPQLRHYPHFQRCKFSRLSSSTL